MTQTQRANDHPRRSVGRDAREEGPTPAEEIAALLGQLYGHVETQESVLRYRTVHRGRRDVAVPEFVIHRTTAPGLIDQLGATAATADTVPVQIRRWERDKGDTCKTDLCPHGRWLYVRTERRAVPGVVTSGAAVPGGSPGWDADGALSPIAAGGGFESAEPVADAFHLVAEIDAELSSLLEELRAAGHQGTLLDIALDDPDAGRRIAARVRTLVTRARIAAGYDAPIVTLRDMYCRHCGGELRVRADASSAVWCVGILPIEGPPLEGQDQPIGYAPCGQRWPRGSWVKLLEQADPWPTAKPPRTSLPTAREGAGGRA